MLANYPNNGSALVDFEVWDHFYDASGWKVWFQVIILVTFFIRWVSEKPKGVRVHWDGKKKLSLSSGTQILIPEFFASLMPIIPLDGYLCRKGGDLQQCLEVVTGQENSKEHAWKEMKLVVIDSPQSQTKFEDRIDLLKENCQKVFFRSDLR